MNSTATHNNFIVEIDSHSQVNQLNMTAKGDFYKIYLLKKFKLRPRGDVFLESKIKINVPKTLEPWINLLPSLKGLGLKIEDNDWVSNKTKNDTIQLHILNRSFSRTIEIRKKPNYCVFIFIRTKEYR